jgi:NTP pyrophosphatase (non-canonical NTP hydrolase)
MEFSVYQRLSRESAMYPNKDRNFVFPALGLCGEAGEAADGVKKAIRDDGGVVTDVRREELAAELGDVLWYASQLATEVGLDLDEVARGNLGKIVARARIGRPGHRGDS